MQKGSGAIYIFIGAILMFTTFIVLLMIISYRVYVDIPILLMLYAISLIGLITALYGIIHIYLHAGG